MTEERDSWLCTGCGCGLCVPKGQQPDIKEHVLYNNKVCGTFVYEGPCSCNNQEE